MKLWKTPHRNIYGVLQKNLQETKYPRDSAEGFAANLRGSRHQTSPLSSAPPNYAVRTVQCAPHMPESVAAPRNNICKTHCFSLTMIRSANALFCFDLLNRVDMMFSNILKGIVSSVCRCSFTAFEADLYLVRQTLPLKVKNCFKLHPNMLSISTSPAVENIVCISGELWVASNLQNVFIREKAEYTVASMGNKSFTRQVFKFR